VLSLIDPLSEAQIQYIERLGGKVSQYLNGVEASQLIQELLKDDWRVERASNIYAAERPAWKVKKTVTIELHGKSGKRKIKRQITRMTLRRFRLV
jgi:hypothetical protein